MKRKIKFKDKHGKEIREGDILQTEESGEILEPVVVVRDGGQWRIHTTQSDFILAVRDWHEYEVIGNIYENPDLLNSN